jgi:hypothetical protein
VTTDYIEQINTAIEDIVFLQKLKKNLNPACCMSISVRNGVARDNDDVEDDDVKRPWRTMSFMGSDRGLTDGMEKLIDMLIEDRVRSLKGWAQSADEYAEQLAVAKAKAYEQLNGMSKQ